MDPVARRQMWKIIEKVSQNKSVILVSHSMEEVEALCTRLVVMVSGQIQCIGTPQHLKNKFGGSYEIELRCAPHMLQDCINLCIELMPTAFVEESFEGYVRFHVSEAPKLSIIFHRLEKEKQAMEIENYSVSQCSLEHVFLQFAFTHHCQFYLI